MTMGYSYDALSDLNNENVAAIVKAEAVKFGGQTHFRGKTVDEWYSLAFDAYESWYQGDTWGKLFEKIAEQLEEMDETIDIEDIDE